MMKHISDVSAEFLSKIFTPESKQPVSDEWSEAGREETFPASSLDEIFATHYSLWREIENTVRVATIDPQLTEEDRTLILNCSKLDMIEDLCDRLKEYHSSSDDPTLLSDLSSLYTALKSSYENVTKIATERQGNKTFEEKRILWRKWEKEQLQETIAHFCIMFILGAVTAVVLLSNKVRFQ